MLELPRHDDDGGRDRVEFRLMPKSIWTTSIAVFEIRTALELLDLGRQRGQRKAPFDLLLRGELDGRVQSFDRAAAVAEASAAPPPIRSDTARAA